MKEINLTNGGTVVIDDADYEFLSQFNWRAKLSDGTYGNYHAVRDVVIGNKKLTVRMHRLITEAEHDQIVFHINNDTLDNRRRNLQCYRSNPWTGRASKSGFKGVKQVAPSLWRAEISIGGHVHPLGTAFNDPEVAAIAYDEAARAYYGKQAVTNF